MVLDFEVVVVLVVAVVVVVVVIAGVVVIAVEVVVIIVVAVVVVIVIVIVIVVVIIITNTIKIQQLPLEIKPNKNTYFHFLSLQQLPHHPRPLSVFFTPLPPPTRLGSYYVFSLPLSLLILNLSPPSDTLLIYHHLSLVIKTRRNLICSIFRYLFYSL